MKVLMFGWEFPPFKSGGLGTACYDLTKGLAGRGVDVTFVMPFAPENAQADFVRLIGTGAFGKKIKIKTVRTVLTPYQTSNEYDQQYGRINLGNGAAKEVYGRNLFDEVERYSLIASARKRTYLPRRTIPGRALCRLLSYSQDLGTPNCSDTCEMVRSVCSMVNPPFSCNIPAYWFNWLRLQ